MLFLLLQTSSLQFLFPPPPGLQRLVHGFPTQFRQIRLSNMVRYKWRALYTALHQMRRSETEASEHVCAEIHRRGCPKSRKQYWSALAVAASTSRSEERRVGKECRS